MSKALRLAQITVEHQDCPFSTVFLNKKTSSQNISITLLQISLKLHEHQGGKEQFPEPRYTAASKIGNGVISLPRQLRCHCNPDHNKVSSLFNTTVVLIFPNLCLWQHSLRSNVGGIHPKKLYRATLINMSQLYQKPRLTFKCLSLLVILSNIEPRCYLQHHLL